MRCRGGAVPPLSLSVAWMVSEAMNEKKPPRVSPRLRSATFAAAVRSPRPVQSPSRVPSRVRQMPSPTRSASNGPRQELRCGHSLEGQTPWQCNPRRRALEFCCWLVCHRPSPWSPSCSHALMKPALFRDKYSILNTTAGFSLARANDNAGSDTTPRPPWMT